MAQLDARPTDNPEESRSIFCGHYLPSADSRRADVSSRRKNVHNTGYPFRELSLSSKSVVM